jgi:transposase
MFADEARFGRMNRIRPCWAPLGTRPAVAAQLIRQYIYLYGAVSPKDGTCVYLIMPTSNTASFQAFLQVLARRFARQDILLVLDGAPNHRCGALAVPRNIRLLYLPPYSPELNPKENIWDEIREKIFKNFALKSMDAVRAKLKQAILYLERNPTLVRSITSRGVARLVGIEGGVVSGVFNLESSGVRASDWRPRHDKRYHEA